MQIRLAVAALAIALLTAACSGSEATTTALAGPLPAGAFPVRASSDLGVGTERLLIGIGGPDNQRLGSPDLPVTFEVFPEDDPDAAQQVSATWTWAVEDVSGLYRATVDFDRPGLWLVRVIPEGGEPLELIAVQVQEDPLTPAVGETAPPSDSVTSADAPLEEISTDRNPDPAFYELSIADAVSSGAPSVIVFATPAFCQTATCGPTLDDVKKVASDYPGVNFVHVEVFTNLDDPANLEVVSAVVEWGLATEPWVFVVDTGGAISARFEGVLDDAELRSALDAVG